MTNKYPKDFIERPQGNTLSAINIIREHIIDAIKLFHKTLLEALMNFHQCFSNMQQEPSPPLQLLYKASLKTGKIPIDLKQANITPIYKGGENTGNTRKRISKKYPPLPRNASENEPQATWLPLWQILPLPASGASQLTRY